MNVNIVCLGGNLTGDVEMRFLPDGTAVGKVGLALNSRWKGPDGEDREETTFVDLNLFGKTAELVNEHLGKGDPILVQGRLKLDQWKDKSSGDKRQKLTVTVDRFNFVGGKKDKDEEGDDRPRRSTHDKPKSRKDDDAVQPDADEDIPF